MLSLEYIVIFIGFIDCDEASADIVIFFNARKPIIKSGFVDAILSAVRFLALSALLQVWDKSVMSFLEEFKVILLNNANKVLGIIDLARGGKDFVPVDMKVIFSIALKASASKIILAHNHPSEQLQPSSADRAITKKAIEAGKFLDIEVCDHLIVTHDKYLSLKDEGYFDIDNQ